MAMYSLLALNQTGGEPDSALGCLQAERRILFPGSNSWGSIQSPVLPWPCQSKACNPLGHLTNAYLSFNMVRTEGGGCLASLEMRGLPGSSAPECAVAADPLNCLTPHSVLMPAHVPPARLDYSCYLRVPYRFLPIRAASSPARNTCPL